MKVFILNSFVSAVLLCVNSQSNAHIQKTNHASENNAYLPDYYKFLSNINKLQLPIWLTTGNTGTNIKSDFLGTKDNQGLAFRTRN